MERNLTIAVFGQKRLSREGGVEIVVKELCTRMAQQGCQVTCYNRSGHHVSGAEYDDIDNTNYEGIRQKYVPTIEKKGLAAVSASAFAALYSAFGKYDVVHIHAEGPAFFSWLPKMFGKRVVVTIHGVDWQREKWQSGFGSQFIRQGEKNAVKYADEIIVLSKGVQDYFKETYDRKTHFIPNGVNRPQIREAGLITEKFGLKKDSYILFLGRLVPEKGIRYLVEHIVNVSGEDPIISTTGKASRELFETRVANGQSHKYDFLTVGSMGHSSSIALGVAINKPDTRVWCIDGDGAVLMHMGSMAVLGANAPKNMIHIVINNGAHETVGGMPTVASKIDLVAIAKACGYPNAVSVDNFKDLDDELEAAKSRNELSFIEAKCSIGARDNLGRPTTTALENKINFMEYLKTL